MRLLCASPRGSQWSIPGASPVPGANYRQHLSFCPNDPAKSILIPAPKQQGPLRREGSRSITTSIRRRGREDVATGNRPYPRSPACFGYPTFFTVTVTSEQVQSFILVFERETDNRRTTAVTGPPPKDYDFETHAIGGSRSPHGYRVFA